MIANFDVIQSAKDPKYSPIRRRRGSTGNPFGNAASVGSVVTNFTSISTSSSTNNNNNKFTFTTSRFSKDEDDLENQVHLFDIQCETIKMRENYQRQNQNSDYNNHHQQSSMLSLHDSNSVISLLENYWNYNDDYDDDYYNGDDDERNNQKQYNDDFNNDDDDFNNAKRLIDDEL